MGNKKGSASPVRAGPNPGNTPACCQLSILTGTQRNAFYLPWQSKTSKTVPLGAFSSTLHVFIKWEHICWVSSIPCTGLFFQEQHPSMPPTPGPVFQHSPRWAVPSASSAESPRADVLRQPRAGAGVSLSSSWAESSLPNQFGAGT